LIAKSFAKDILLLEGDMVNVSYLNILLKNALDGDNVDIKRSFTPADEDVIMIAASGRHR
jgi:hypothetical protein